MRDIEGTVRNLGRDGMGYSDQYGRGPGTAQIKTAGQYSLELRTSAREGTVLYPSLLASSNEAAPELIGRELPALGRAGCSNLGSRALVIALLEQVHRLFRVGVTCSACGSQLLLVAVFLQG